MTVSEKGFTLIEIMVSLAVLAIVFGALFKLQSSTAALSEAADFKSLSFLLARQTISELEQNGFDPDRLAEEYHGYFRDYSIACEVRDGIDEGDWESILADRESSKLKKITMIIYGPGKRRSLTFKTWRYMNAR